MKHKTKKQRPWLHKTGPDFQTENKYLLKSDVINLLRDALNYCSNGVFTGMAISLWCRHRDICKILKDGGENSKSVFEHPSCRSACSQRVA